ncbi:MAG TPA: type II toxin-antitoxin system HicB family antitoxin, partial [Tepidisphaeraceae bacterium]|nr:type II toxin-antitoxin system HicB family antitoxin [Tepidisphaeraceae bacterium]
MTSLLKYKGYLAKVEFDADEKVLRGEVLGTRDVVTFQADGAADVEREFRGSVDDYLAFCKERGERPEKPASGQFVARIDP